LRNCSNGDHQSEILIAHFLVFDEESEVRVSLLMFSFSLAVENGWISGHSRYLLSYLYGKLLMQVCLTFDFKEVAQVLIIEYIKLLAYSIKIL
jgi:hypothetical protein